MSQIEPIKDFLRDNRLEVNNFGVKRLAVFGSIAKHTANEKSDVDILVEFHEGKKNYDNFIELCFWLEEQLQRPVDLVTQDSLSPIFYKSIERDLVYVDLN